MRDVEIASFRANIIRLMVVEIQIAGVQLWWLGCSVTVARIKMQLFAGLLKCVRVVIQTQLGHARH